MKSTFLTALAICLATTTYDPAQAQSAIGAAEDVVSVDLLEGWREADGRHIAAIRLNLSEGWKTYWRAPGDGGLPTTLQWGHSNNIDNLRIMWPRPTVFDEGGMRSLGYQGEVILPLELTPNEAGDMMLNARLHFGVCKEVCVPAVVDLQNLLQGTDATGVTEIRSALVTAPKAADHTAVHSVHCQIEATEKGHSLMVHVSADLPGKTRAMVVEFDDPEVWVSSTDLQSDGRQWYGTTQLFDHRDTPAAVSPQDLRITLLTDHDAIDIQGCSLP